MASVIEPNDHATIARPADNGEASIVRPKDVPPSGRLARERTEHLGYDASMGDNHDGTPRVQRR
jgi:hypothetical protein